MSADEIRHVALPKLYGGPAYARPVMLIESSERPFDPDELPLVVAMTDEERAIIDEDRRLAAQDVAPPPPTLQSKPFRDRKSTRLNSSHIQKSRMPSSA